jgi:putative transposase
MRSRLKTPDYIATCFITSTIINWVPVFTDQEYYDILIDAFKFNQSQKNLKIFAYVLLDNHFHMLCQSDNLTNTIRSIKSYSAKRIIEKLKIDGKNDFLKIFKINKRNYKNTSTYQIWQEGFHPFEINSDSIFNQKLEYIHLNPVKRGLVENPIEWSFSSAFDYYWGKEGKIRLDYFDYEE